MSGKRKLTKARSAMLMELADGPCRLAPSHPPVRWGVEAGLIEVKATTLAFATIFCLTDAGREALKDGG